MLKRWIKEWLGIEALKRSLQATHSEVMSMRKPWVDPDDAPSKRKPAAKKK